MRLLATIYLRQTFAYSIETFRLKLELNLQCPKASSALTT